MLLNIVMSQITAAQVSKATGICSPKSVFRLQIVNIGPKIKIAINITKINIRTNNFE